MKKIFTFFAAVLFFSAAFAQDRDYGRGRDRNDDVAYNERGSRDRDGYHFSKREMNIQIARINQEYDHKVQSVRSRWLMNSNKKQRIIWDLEKSRNYEIRKVYQKYNSRANRFGDNRRNW